MTAEGRYGKRKGERMSIDSLEQFVDTFHGMLEKKPEWAELLQNGKSMLSQLVLNPNWFQSTLTRLVLDGPFLKAQWQSIDANEIQIYRSSDKLFSIRAYIWEPNVTYPIHDHGAWGIVGAHINHITERKFMRLDDGGDDHYAQLRQTSERLLSPGEITYVLPLNDGIHQMAAAEDRTAVSIHVYGTPIRKGFIHYFDLERKAARRMYPPAINKKIFAIRTLGSIPEPWAEKVLRSSLDSDEPDYMKTECREALSKLRG